MKTIVFSNLVKEAIRIAQSGTPGPVFVEMPLDTLYPYALTAAEGVGDTGKDTSLAGRITNFYMNAYLHNLFTQAFTQHVSIVCTLYYRGLRAPLFF